MAVFRCKICGGNLHVEYGQKIAECEYCGVTQTVCIFTEPNVQAIYDRASSYLAHNEFDKAENLFSQLLFDDKQNAEAYWNILMCRYGVNYVKDPASGRYIPTCNRTLYTPIFSDENYQKAIEFATSEQKHFFEENAHTIDNIQKGILTVSRHEKPFDIFISYKETDQNGNRTQDSIVAARLYEKLTEAGYKVFYSRITLEDKAGTEYEPYIYAALYSSKVMLTVSSSRENMEAVWVRNEWGRFMSLQQTNAGKHLIPLYFDMPKADLPEEFALIPSFNIKEEGFEAELLRNIKKLIPVPISLAQRRKNLVKTLGIAAASFLAAITVCAVLVVPNIINGNKYDAAMQLFNEQEYAAAQQAFIELGDYENAADMANQCGLKIAYIEAKRLFDNQQYQEAKAVFENLGDYEDAREMAQRCDRQPEYDAAMQLYYDGDYAQATWAFAAMDDYEDAADMQKKAALSWRKLLANIIVSDFDVYASAVYYINENGTVDTLKGTHGNAHSNLRITEHGKIISIEMGKQLYALHEDGYVSNAKSNNKLNDESQWHDIVKISRFINSTNLALRADGKMLFGTLGESDDDWAAWLSPISQWEGIVDFECDLVTYLDNYVGEGVVIGIKADGTLCGVGTISRSYMHTWDYQEQQQQATYIENEGLNRILQQFSNVKALRCKFNYPYGADILAITKDGKIQSYTKGIFQEIDYQMEGAPCDVMSTTTLLDTGGCVRAFPNGKTVMSDIVHRNYISRTGTIYRVVSGGAYGLQGESLEAKTTVWDEWLGRFQ